MPLTVIGAGLGRTGTLSLKVALDQLGVGPCYHMKELAARIPCREQTIRNMLSAGEFEKGVHYFQKHRRVIFIWSKIKDWMSTRKGAAQAEPFVPSHARSRQAR